MLDGRTAEVGLLIRSFETMSVQFPDQWQDLKVNLAHDWLTGMRGGEHCLELLCRGFPSAPVHTLICRKDSISDDIRSHPIQTSWLQRVPGIFDYYRYGLPLFPSAISSFKPESSDLVISTSHCVAKGMPKPAGSRHICYCFTPMRYAWVFYEEYFGKNLLKKALLKPVLNHLRAWDLAASGRVDTFIGISKHVCSRIEQFYKRDAELVYPPVKTTFYTPDEKVEPEEFDLVVSALVPYKRIDLAVEAYTRSGYPLKIIGVGTETEHLKARAGANIEFLGWASNESIRDHYRRCRCLVFPGEEDFGIVPLEVQACGRPVIAFRKGGTLETVVEGTSGVFFDEQTPESIQQAAETAGKTAWQTEKIRENALKFSEQAYIDGLNRVIVNTLG